MGLEDEGCPDYGVMQMTRLEAPKKMKMEVISAPIFIFIIYSSINVKNTHFLVFSIA